MLRGSTRVILAEMLRTLNQLDGGKETADTVHHRLGVGIHHHHVNFWHSEKSLDDVMKKGFARERTIVFARHALAVVTHGDKGGEFHALILLVSPDCQSAYNVLLIITFVVS